MSKKKSGKKASAPKMRAAEILQSRKAQRKERRLGKKRGRMQFALRRAGKEVKEVDKVDEGEVKKMQENRRALEERKKKAEKRREKMRRKRKRDEDREEDDKAVREFGKKLKMKKDKIDEVDGLDFLLDGGDSGEESAGAEGEDQDGEDREHEEEESGDDGEGEEDEEEEKVEDEDDEGEEEEDEELGASDEDEEGASHDDDDEEEEEEGDSDASDVGGDDPEIDTEDGGKEIKKSETWEDIYGRTRSKDGEVLPAAPQKYIPPALRARMAAEAAASGGEEAKRKERLAKLRRRCQGLLNRLAAANMSPLARELESLYASSGHARADLNECLFGLLSESLLEAPSATPERMVLEHACLVALLHANIGIEVGATMLQSSVEKYQEFRPQYDPEANNKQLDNVLLFIAHLFSFKVVEAQLVFDIMNELAESFSDKDVELIVVVLKSAGFALRKADPSRLKELILKIQRKSSEAKSDANRVNTRVDFMLDVLMAIRNNNVRKIPNYDDSHQQFLAKAMKQWLRPGCQPSPLAVGLKDLLSAESKGRWWIVGSAWAGKDNQNTENGQENAGVEAEPSLSSELLEKARQMRMNTDARKNIFCAIMSAGDYMDAFEKLTKIKITGKQKEREVAFVVSDCGLQERTFNPYYAELAARLCKLDRKYMLAFQCGLWDKIKILNELEKFQYQNLADFTSHLLCRSALPLSALKVVEWGEMNKRLVQFLKRTLKGPLSKDPQMFASLSKSPKLADTREGLRLFMRHFIAKKDPSLAGAVKTAEAVMMTESKLRL